MSHKTHHLLTDHERDLKDKGDLSRIACERKTAQTHNSFCCGVNIVTGGPIVVEGQQLIWGTPKGWGKSRPPTLLRICIELFEFELIVCDDEPIDASVRWRRESGERL
jgi:hypothetical protein